MYYKSRRRKKEPTYNGVAISESLQGPYRKYEGNPLMKGHGHFCWRYKHGVVMIPHHENWIHWSEDGIHFAPVANDPNSFTFGTLYVPYPTSVTSHGRKYIFSFTDPIDLMTRRWNPLMLWKVITGPSRECTTKNAIPAKFWNIQRSVGLSQGFRF